MSASSKCMKATIENLVKMRLSKGIFDRNFEKLQIVSASEGCCVAVIKVSPEHCNFNKVMHGGMVASLADVVSTMALLTYDTTKPGVSTDLNISYLRAAKIGSVVLIDAKSLKRGKNIAFLAADFIDKDTKSLLATARHTKFVK